MHRIHVIILAFAFFLACANQGFPPGGPEDRTPPFILSTFPAPDSTNIPQDVNVKILFSEPVNPTSCQEALFITPFPGENIRYKWKKDKELTIIFNDSLLDNRTYVITIGSGTRDRRNNAMENSFTLAFSTGEVLDNGRVSGFVYGDGVEGAQIWAFDLADTTKPDPASRFPLYITQAGSDGAYRMTNMALSQYRLFAVLDRDVNNIYNVEFDMIGVSTRDVRLDSTTDVIDHFNFRMTLQDTTPPQLSAARAPDNSHVELRFSEAMLADCLAVVSNYAILADNDSLKILNAATDFYNAAIVRLATAKQDSNHEYKVVVKNAFDLNYLPILPDSNFAFFQGSPLPDTTKPSYVAMQPHDSSKFVLSFTPLHFYFSKAMQPESIQDNLVVADTLGDTLKGDIKWPEQSHYIFEPTEKFASERFYRVALPVDSVFDLAGNPLADTLFQRQFTSVNPDTLTAISGTVFDTDTTATGPFYVRAFSANEQNENGYKISIEEPGPYSFENMLPGSYTIELYRDEDENGRFSYGKAFPYEPAERYWIYPDTISIRARWPTEGEDIFFP